MHVATDHARVVPRGLAKAVFDYAFNGLGKEMLLAVVNSTNQPALRLDRWLGFIEVLTLSKMHDGDGDIIVMAMPRNGCRWIKESNVKVPTSAS
jgi:RimJ/RimL family protein N-acetyltransferase